MQRLDWAGLMQAGIAERGLLPSQFWALTPAELMLLLGRTPAAAPMLSSRLEELAAAWPDEKETRT